MTLFNMKFKQRLVVFNVIVIIFMICLILITNFNKYPVKCIKFANKSNNILLIKYGSAYVERKLIPFVKDDGFRDLEHYLRDIQLSKIGNIKAHDVIILEDTDLDNPTLGHMIGLDEKDWPKTNLGRFQMAIRKQELYKENDPLVDRLLNDMIYLPIKGVEKKKYGTQIKFVLDFGKDRKALLKPQRFLRNEEVDPNHYYFQEFERHNSEIASYHLDRALGFRRVMPAVGRRLNLKTDIFKFVNEDIKKTFFTSPAKNLCFYGECMLYCNLFDPICGQPDHIEGSLSAFLPQIEEGYVWEWKHPWKRSYDPRVSEIWEVLPDGYCKHVRKQPLYAESRKLLDVMDLVIFDFLIGNVDRHSYEYFTIWGNDSTTIHLDNGRGFGKAFEDDLTILAGVIHCCLIRDTTLKTLLKFHNGPKPLSKIMNESMANDPLAPLLADQHLYALDRRVNIILKEIRNCINNVDLEHKLSSNTLSFS